MINYEMFKSISPNGRDFPLKKDSLEVFLGKARPFLPYMPDDVLAQWAYENFECFCESQKWNIEYDRLCFVEIEMNINELLKIQDASKFYDNGVGLGMIDDSNCPPLGEYMKEHGTWPRSIIVLDTMNSLIDDKFDYLFPYQLLEGHLRLVYLRRMVDAEFSVNKIHKVWLATRV